MEREVYLRGGLKRIYDTLNIVKFEMALYSTYNLYLFKPYGFDILCLIAFFKKLHDQWCRPKSQSGSFIFISFFIINLVRKQFQ